jgi:hypothetical protein
MRQHTFRYASTSTRSKTHFATLLFTTELALVSHPLDKKIQGQSDAHMIIVPPGRDPRPAFLVIIKPTPHISQPKRLAPQKRDAHAPHDRRYHLELDRGPRLSCDEVRFLALAGVRPFSPATKGVRETARSKWK